MKKYFLKISGLTTIAIPLVTVIACSGEDTRDTKGKTQTYDFSDAKTKIKDFKSSKDRGELKAYLEGKIKGAKITLDGIGYTEPTNLLYGVTIDSEKYTLEEVMPDNAKTFKIKVTLKKGMEETTKIIEITAKDYDFTTLKTVLEAEQTSTKIRGVINAALMSKSADIEKAESTLTDTDLAQIGYTKPSELVTAKVEAKYKLKDKSKLLEEGKIELEVTLKKYLETQKHIITLKAKNNDFAAQKRTLGTTGTSSKNKGDLITALGAKNIGDVLVSSDWVSLGYTPSSLTGVTVQYTLNDKSQVSASGNGKFKIKATLTKDNETKDHIIEISPAPTSTSTGV